MTRINSLWKWLTDLPKRSGRFMAALLSALIETQPPAGVVNANIAPMIDDGVDYSLPLPLPQFALGDEELRAEAQQVQASDPGRSQMLMEQADKVAHQPHPATQNVENSDELHDSSF